MKVVKRELVTMTSRKASELLQKNDNNRKLHPRNVQYFVDIIESGEWQGTEKNAIQVDVAGKVINGQHLWNLFSRRLFRKRYLWLSKRSRKAV